MSRLINQNGLDLVKHFEGLYIDAYICPAGVPTVGYGHTGNVELGQSITPKEAEPEMVIEQYKVDARSGLRMRAGASAEFEILTTLPLNKTLSIGKELENWVEVDLESDGIIDGWVYKSYLVKVDALKLL